MLAADSSTSERTLVLGILLALYPLGPLFGAPVIGSLSDRFGRKPVLLVSLAASTIAYCVIAVALEAQSLALLMGASLFAGLCEANIAVALGPTAPALAICLPGAAAMVSEAVDARRRGRALGNNQSLQVGAEAASGVADGALAAIVVKLPLPVLAAVAMGAAGTIASVSPSRIRSRRTSR